MTFPIARAHPHPHEVPCLFGACVLLSCLCSLHVCLACIGVHTHTPCAVSILHTHTPLVLFPSYTHTHTHTHTLYCFHLTHTHTHTPCAVSILTHTHTHHTHTCCAVSILQPLGCSPLSNCPRTVSLTGWELGLLRPFSPRRRA